MIMKKHLLSVLLVICMVVVLAPSVLAATYVAEVNGTECPTIAEAIERANPGDTVILLTNVTNLPQIDKAITIDGNGHHVTAKADERQFGVIDGTVTLKNLVFDIGTEAIRTDYGNYGGVSTDYENLDLVIDGCTFNNLEGYAILGGQAEKKTLKSLTVTGCTFNATGTKLDNYMVWAQQVGTLSVTGCTFNGGGITKGAIHTGEPTAVATVANISGNEISGVARGVQIGNRVSGSSITVAENTFTNITTAADSKAGAVYIHSNSNVTTTEVSVDTNEFDANSTVLYNDGKSAEQLAQILIFADDNKQDGTVITELTSEGSQVTVPVTSPIVKVNGEGCKDFNEAISTANKLTGEVTIEIYGKVEYTFSTPNLTGSYDSINFVGITDDAEISNTRNAMGSYISGTGNNPDVTFTDLILSRPNGNWYDDDAHMGYFFTVYRVKSVTYTGCTFPDGACCQGSTATYTDCDFYNNDHGGKYSLWVYADVDCTVEDCDFMEDRGIKMYAEGKAKTSDLTVTNTSFEKCTAKPAIVLTYGESVTLDDNTYSTKGVFELDHEGDPDGTSVTADIGDIACRNDDYDDCGVLVDGKIYITVNDAKNAGAITETSTVTLMYDAAETVELPAGVTLNRNGYTAAGVTVAAPVATMNGKAYSSLQAAIDEATKAAGSYEIVLASGTNDEDIIIHQTEGVNITIRGNGEDTVISGYIEVYGHCRNTGAETLTFDGVVFSTSEASHVFIEQTCMTATNESADKCYPHNITVQNCSFTATCDALNTAVGMKFRYGYNIKVTETTGTGLHSLMQNYAGQGLIIEDVTITGGKNGIALGTSQNVSVSDLTVEAIGYGLRVDAENATTITVEDSDIEAFIPVVVRNATANVDLVFNGNNTMTETNTDGIWCAIGTDEYETNGKMPTAPTGGTINVKLNDIGLDADGVYGEKELLLPEIISYDITFDANGGDCATETLTTDSDGKLSELPVATRTGYTFNGWYNGTEKVDTDTVYTQNTTLTAKWTASKYTVTLVTNGGTIRSGDVTEYTYGVGAVLPTNVTRSGYTFDGWYDNEACKGSPVTEIKTTDIENKTFYAKWTYIYLPVIPSTPTYPPVVDCGNNGDVVVTPKNPQKGDTVIITPNPDEGFEVDEIIVTDKNGNSVTVVDNGNGTYSFKQPSGKVNIEVTFKEIKIDTTCHGGWTCPMHDYTDLNTTAWYHDGIHFCIENGLMGSTSNEKLTFDPDLSTTRAMIVTILWRLEGEPIVNYAMTFEDVADGMWYTEAIRWAQSTGVVEGYSAEKFGPNDTITREQMATIMWRYAKDNGYDVSVGENTNILSYDDAFDVADWAMPAMQWSCGAGLIKGIESGNTMDLEPQGNATRAQVATILQRFCENVAES